VAEESGYKIASAFVQVDPEMSDFRERLQAGLDEAIAGVSAEVEVGLNDDDLRTKLERDKADLNEMDGREVGARLGLDDDDFRGKIDADKDDLDAIDGREGSAALKLDDDDFRTKLDRDKDDFDELDGDVAEATLGLDDDDFRTKLAEDEAALRSLSGTASLGAKGGAGAGEGEGSLLGALTLGIGALSPGIGGAVAGMGLLAGTGVLALGGVMKAVEAHSQASQNVGQTGAQLAATAFSNSVAIQQAQQSEQEAYEQSAEAASQSGAQIQSAQMSLSEAVRNSAQAQAQALQAVTQAQQQEQQSAFGLSSAEYNLSNSWIQARYALLQLNDSERDSATTIRAARVAVEQAQYQQLLTDQNAMSTSLDRQQAAVAVTQAQEQLTAAQQQASYVTQEANLQDKAGVAGSQQVVSARQAVRQAVEAVRNAELSAADAQRNLTDTELNDASQVKAAQLAVSQAEQQSAYQQEQSAQQIRQAIRNVSDTYKEQRLQAAATASTSNSAANQYLKDMARLSPAARGFVRELLGMHGAFRTLETDAQNAVMPGLSVFLRGVRDILPEIGGGVRAMGSAMSDAFAKFGTLMQTPAFASGLSGLIRNGVQFADIVLPSFATFLQQLGLLGSRKGAVTGLADGLSGLGQGLTGLVRGLTPYIPVFDEIFQVVGKFLKVMGPELAQTIGATAEAFRPLFAFLNSKAGAPFLRMLAGFAAAMLTLKGLAKLLPGQLGESFGKIPGLIAKPLEKAGGFLLKTGMGWAKSLGGSMVSGLKSLGGSIWGAIEGPLGTAAGTVARWGGQFASQIGSMAGSAARFAVQIGEQMASAAGAVAGWIASNTIAAATYIGSNLAMAASATAAFIAENAATLGIGAAIAVLVGGIVFLATHWSRSWNDIKHWAEDAWHFIYDGIGKYILPFLGPAGLIAFGVIELAKHWNDVWGGIQTVTEAVWQDGIQPVFQWIGQGASDLYNDVLLPVFRGWQEQFQLIETVALAFWRDGIDPVWQGIEAGARDFVTGFEKTWDLLKSVFEAPVNVLISTVYDNGIRRLWNDVVNAVGLHSLDLPHIPSLAGGGIVPGPDRGYDSRLVAMRPEEGVLQPGAVRAIGPGTVHALNAQYGDKPVSGASLGGMLGKAAVKIPAREIVKHIAERPAEHLLGFSGGGILGSLTGIWNSITGIGRGILDGAKWAYELARDPAQAITQLLSKVIGTNATGDLGKVMEAIPRTLIGDLAKVFGLASSSSGGGGGGRGGPLPGGGSGAVGDLPANWKTIASFLASHGFTRYAAAGVAGNVFAESGGNPEILQIGGGGGGGLIQWTPYPPSYITGNYQADLYRQLNAILSWSGGPSLVNRATSPSNAALIYQNYYERPANLSSSLPARESSANAVYQAMGWGKFDGGGLAMPAGMPGGMPFNQTGQPEAILDPYQTRLFQEFVSKLTSGATGGAAQPQVSFNYFGPQQPTPEMQANMRRDMALAFSSG
jgi:hypothetical protein